MSAWITLFAQITAVVVGPLMAIIAHELTHYVTIWPVAENVEIRRKDRFRLETVYQLYNDPWRMRWADISNISPSIIGVAFLIWTFFNPIPITVETLWMVPTWLVYTVGGSADYAAWLP